MGHAPNASDERGSASASGLAVRIATTVDAVIVSWADYVSHCKLCGRVVLRSHAWKWSTKPMGIVHEECP